MADTKRTLSQLVTFFADNTTRLISAQRLRDFLVSTYGSREINTVAINTTLTTDHDIVLVDANSGNIDITLPAATTNSNKTYTIKKTDSSANYVKLIPGGGDTIDGETTFYLLTTQQSVTIVSDGTVWKISDGGYRQGFVKIFEQTATASLPASPADTTILSTGVGTKTIPANWFTPGAAIRIEAIGEAVNAANTFDIQTHVLVGSSAKDSDTVANSTFWATGALARIVIDIVCRSAGATGDFAIMSKLEVYNNLEVEAHDPTLVVVDTTASNLLNFTIETVTTNFDSFDVTNLRILASK